MPNVIGWYACLQCAAPLEAAGLIVEIRMHTELRVKFNARDEFVLPLDQVPQMDPQQARQWLDSEFVRLDCEPIRASGKVLNADKVVRVAQTAGARAFADPAWAQAFASAARAALDRSMIVIDAENTTISF